MKRLLTYLKEYRKECILGPLFKLLEAFFELLVPLVVASIIDVGISSGDRSYVISRCLILVVLGLVGLASSITAQYFAAKAASGFANQLRRNLYRHIQTLSFSQLDQLGTATLMTRMTSDVNQIQTGINLTLRLLLRSPLIVFGSLIMAFTIDFKAALVFMAAIPVLAAVVALIMYLCIPLYKKVQSALDRVMGLSRENLSGVRVIRAFGKEREETGEFEKRTDFLAGSQLKVGRISALMNPLTYVVINIAIIVLVWVGAWQVEAGLLTQGAVVALYNYMAQILVELIKLANLIINITKAIACAGRVNTIFDVQAELTSPENDAPLTINKDQEVAVEFKQASLHYPGGSADAVKNICLKVKKGETIGIIGGTGSGKTSMVNLIPRFYDASEGMVLVDGVDVQTYPVKTLREKIGLVPQQATLFQGTIRENLQWGKKNASDEELWRALELAQGAEVVRQKDGGLDARVEQRGRNLSGGQRQRLTIARALVREPEILILDDSASALDYATDAALRQAIAALGGYLTVFIVSQRASSVRYADRIVVLDGGTVAGVGTSEELLDSCSVYREIYETQFSINGEGEVHE